jgi:hypothetical protein
MDENGKLASITTMGARQAVQIVILGAAVGLAMWGVEFLLETYVLRAVLCQGSVAYCASASQYANILATLVGMGAGLFGLVRLQVFRPLLVALAAAICFWGLIGVISVLPWYEVGIACMLLYALSYILFAWIARIRLFSLAALIAFLLVVIVRLVLVA